MSVTWGVTWRLQPCPTGRWIVKKFACGVWFHTHMILICPHLATNSLPMSCTQIPEIPSRPSVWWTWVGWTLSQHFPYWLHLYFLYVWGASAKSIARILFRFRAQLWPVQHGRRVAAFQVGKGCRCVVLYPGFLSQICFSALETKFGIETLCMRFADSCICAMGNTPLLGDWGTDRSYTTRAWPRLRGMYCNIALETEMQGYCLCWL